VQDRDAFETRAKPGTTLAANPERQSNLGHKKDCRFSAGQRFLHGAQVHFGFAASGDAVKQLHPKGTQLESRTNSLEGVFLFGVQFVRRGRVTGVERIFAGIHRLLPAFQQAVAQHAVDQGARDVHKTQESWKGKRAALSFEQQADSLFFFGKGLVRFLASRGALPGDDALRFPLLVLDALANFN
jgi:hypothetical protein